MKIVSAEFVTSVAGGGDVSAAGTPVVALVGRSNVGKSRLINALTDRRIARAGAKPGTTRLVNIYRVRVSASARARPVDLTLADLPGYGFARGGREARRDFEALTREFFDHAVVGRTPPRSATRAFRLAGSILLVDGRHPGLAADLTAHAWLRDRRYPLRVVTTKNDRLSPAKRAQTHREHERHFGDRVLAVSSKTGAGIDDVWTAIASLL